MLHAFAHELVERDSNVYNLNASILYHYYPMCDASSPAAVVEVAEVAGGISGTGMEAKPLRVELELERTLPEEEAPFWRGREERKFNGGGA